MTKQDDLTKKVEAYYTQAKPPFDPLNAGWVMCACRCHQSEFVRGHRHDECPTCEGLGIVVAPPKDGCRVIPWRGTRVWDQAVRDAHERSTTLIPR
jgi:hypothetical protein